MAVANVAHTVAAGVLTLRGAMVDRGHLLSLIVLTTFLVSVFTWHLLVALRRHSKRYLVFGSFVLSRQKACHVKQRDLI